MDAIILAIDTSTRTIGLALYDGSLVLSESVWTSQDHHTIELAPAVTSILARSGLTIADVGAVAVSTGPGSFTGLRIGMGLAKGICMARHLPLIGIPTLDSLASAQPVIDLPMAAVLQAGRKRLAVGWYLVKDGDWKPAHEVEVITAKELSDRIRTATYICGEIGKEERRILRRKHKNAVMASPAHSLRRPAFLAQAAWKRLENLDVDDPAELAPVYIHHKEPIPG